MDFNQLWQDYKDLILVIAAAAIALLFREIIPGLWKLIVGLWEKLRTGLGRRLSASAFEKRYLEWLCEEHRFLQMRGIRTRSPVPVELERIYVSLTLSRPSRYRPDTRAGTEAALREEFPHGERPKPTHGLDIRTEEPERLTVSEVLQHYPERLVILGGPGTGKTTLVNYLALKFAQRKAREELGLDEEHLPILIPLRELPRTGLTLSADNLPTLCTTPEQAKECPDGFFEERLNHGQCIVLLDGMDEVTTEEKRRWVAEQIEDFVNIYSSNRFVVTSRPVGYSGVALTGFTQLDVCDFSDEDVEAFTRHWCLALELAARGVESEVSEAVARRKAEREAGELVAAIRANDRVRRLTVNPLLLTIVATVHRYRATLPNRRVDLYDECTEVLLGYWDEAKGIAGQLDWARKRRALEPLAYWMHKQGLREAERARVEQVIAEALPTVGEKGENAAEFLKNVQERSGLLMERGLDIYGFSHLTFQEYLTASHLIDRGAEGREELLSHLHDPWWLEVTLLYAGMRDATPLIRAILADRDDLFKNNLFLAARCLVDRLNIDPQVEEAVLSKLLVELRNGEFQGLREGAARALVELGGSPSASKVRRGLVAMLGDEDSEVRWRAAFALSELGEAEPLVIEVLLERLGDEDGDVRWEAASALGKLGEAEPRVIEALLERLGDEDATVRGAAALALGRLGGAELRVIEALLGRLGDEDENVRGEAASALGESGEAEPRVIEVLLGRLGDEDENVRWKAASALGKLGESEPRVIEALLERLGDEDVRVGWAAASALGKLGESEPWVVEALLERLGVEVGDVRWAAAFALGKLRRAEPRVIEALLERLGDEDVRVRGEAASALGELGEAEPRVIEALLGRLGDEDVCFESAFALGKLGDGEPRVIEALLERLGDEDVRVRWEAAFALGELGDDEPRVIEALLDRLGDADENVREEAAFALSELGEADPRVMETLLDRLSDQEESVRVRAAFGLRRLRVVDPGVVKALLDRLTDDDKNVRSAVALALDPGMRPSLPQGIQPTVSENIPALRRYLENETEIEYPFIKTRLKVKDLAWRLLQWYGQETGERIHRTVEGAE